MLRLCSESSRSYPGRPVRHAVKIDSADGGNAISDRTGVSRRHSRCRTSMWIAHRLETSRENITEDSPHQRTEHLREDKPQ